MQAVCPKVSRAPHMKLLAPLAPFLILICFSAMAQSRMDYSTTSWIEIHEPDEDHRGARAAVTFRNDFVHGPDDNTCYPLTLDNFTVDVCFEWNVGGVGNQNERMTVIPPDGYISIPAEIDVPELVTETIHIYGSTS